MMWGSSDTNVEMHHFVLLPNNDLQLNFTYWGNLGSQLHQYSGIEKTQIVVQALFIQKFATFELYQAELSTSIKWAELTRRDVTSHGPTHLL